MTSVFLSEMKRVKHDASELFTIKRSKSNMVYYRTNGSREDIESRHIEAARTVRGNASVEACDLCLKSEVRSRGVREAQEVKQLPG